MARARKKQTKTNRTNLGFEVTMWDKLRGNMDAVEGPLYELAQQNRQSSTLLSFRDALVPKLLSGRVRMRVGPTVTEIRT